MTTRNRATTTLSSSPPSAKPYGREQVVESLVAAASKLFAERGPAQVSVRDVAKAAGVNHALVHRHFETKERLVEAVMERFALEFRDEARRAKSLREAGARLDDVLLRKPEFLRLLAFLILEGAPPARMVVPNGGLAALAGLAAEGEPDDEDRARTIVGAALSMGFVMFEPFLRQAIGAEVDRDLIRATIRAAHQGMRAPEEKEAHGGPRA